MNNITISKSWIAIIEAIFFLFAIISFYKGLLCLPVFWTMFYVFQYKLTKGK